MLKIEKVIYNPPATIVLWNDGEKTVVKCRVGDIYDRETGLFLCIAKRLFGNTGRYNDEVEKWLELSRRDVCDDREQIKYDEETVFSDPNMIHKIEREVDALSLSQLVVTAMLMKKGKLSSALMDIINMPDYLRKYFVNLPTGIKNRTIIPLTKIVYQAIGKKYVNLHTTDCAC